MTVIMFWNVKRGSAVPYLQAACLENNVDILILAEDEGPKGYTEKTLNSLSKNIYEDLSSVGSGIKFFLRNNSGALKPISDLNNRVSIRSYTSNTGFEIIIASAHVPSKLHASDDDQYFFARTIRSGIEQAENKLGHQKSIIIGDFNMNPFEKGMTAFDGLHGVMDKYIARQGGRTFSGNYSAFFYNPMWSRLGDENVGPPGTYFYNSSGTANYYWNIFDQILIRPSLLDFYMPDSIRIITNIGNLSLIDKSRVMASVSDHLPVLLNLNF